jgi:rhodanese-related sulfurtransferase
MRSISLRGILTILFLLAVFSPTLFADETVPRIGQEQLLGMLDDASLTILDARIVKDWRKSDSKIKGAVRVDPHDVSSWIGNYSKDQKIVVYCS